MIDKNLFGTIYVRYTKRDVSHLSRIATEKLWASCFMYSVEKELEKMSQRDAEIFFMFIIMSDETYCTEKKSLIKSKDYSSFKDKFDIIRHLKQDSNTLKNIKTQNTLIREWYRKNISDSTFYASIRCLFPEALKTLEQSKNYSLMWNKISFMFNKFNFTEEEKLFLKKWCEQERKERGETCQK